VVGTPFIGTQRTDDQLLRIAHEAVTNAVRHAGATYVEVELEYLAGAVRLHVMDDGHGFDLEHPENTLEGHVGLASMKERAEIIGARFSVSTGVGQGTAIEVIAPHRQGA
jgi:signal transduction histidine kinase